MSDIIRGLNFDLFDIRVKRLYSGLYGVFVLDYLICFRWYLYLDLFGFIVGVFFVVLFIFLVKYILWGLMLGVGIYWVRGFYKVFRNLRRVGWFSWWYFYF